MKTRCRTLAVWVGMAGVLGGALGFLGCSPAPDPWAGAAHPRIIVTIPPLYSFVKGVAGERASVKVLCKETGPHAYSYNAQDLYQFQDADLFFAVGLGLDDKFADTLDAQSQKKRRPDFRYIKLGDGLGDDLRLPAKRDHDEHDKGKKEEHGHEHGGEYDPHVWLGIKQAKAMVAAIRDELKKTDAAHAKDYDGNAARYLDTLDDVLTYGKDKLKGGKNKKLISFHDSLEYFAKSFGLDIVDTVELSPGEKPGPGRMKRLVEESIKGDIRVIAVEPQYPPDVPGTLQLEVKKNGREMKLVDVDPLETANGKELEEQGAKWYAHKMKENLDKLAQGLK